MSCGILQPIFRKERKEEGCPSSHLQRKSVFLYGNDLTAIVVAASLASSVGQTCLAAVGASDHTGNRKLPVGAASLIASCFGYFTLGNSHGDTSSVEMPVNGKLSFVFVFQKLL